MEMIGGGENRDDYHYGTLHGANGPGAHAKKQRSQRLPDPRFLMRLSRVEVEWTKREIIWRRDGKEYLRVNIDATAHPDMAAFHRPFLSC